VAQLTIALGCDASGATIKDAVATRLYELTHTVLDLAKGQSPPTESTDVAVAVAREVSVGRAPFGITVDGTGISACIAANKVKGIRAALCHDVTSAVSAREHSDANVLCLAGALIGPRLALAIVETFLTREFAAARYAERLARLQAIDKAR
jgi:ribose 5-phosphate isomerase B